MINRELCKSKLSNKKILNEKMNPSCHPEEWNDVGISNLTFSCNV